MAYKKIKPHLIDEESREQEMRKLWKEEYCLAEIETFDGVKVKFYEDMFDHCFYESNNRNKKDKTILSLNRLEKILWIKDTLQDADAIFKKGWDTQGKKHYTDRRVAIVKDNYVVIILVFKDKKARFMTAYEVTDDENLELIIKSPNW